MHPKNETQSSVMYVMFAVLIISIILIIGKILQIRIFHICISCIELYYAALPHRNKMNHLLNVSLNTLEHAHILAH